MDNIEIIKQLAEDNDSFYLYDEEKILASMNRLKENFPSIKFLYSLKTNPNPVILDIIYGAGFGADAASLEEVRQSTVRGVKKEELQYSAPGKSRRDIEKSIKKATIIADSLNEVKLISDIAVEKKLKAKIGVRINPNFTFAGKKGAAGKFGVDEDLFFEKIEELQELPNIEIVGIHVHSRSQELDYKVIEKYYKNLLDLADRVNKALDGKLEFLNMGSGIGIPYEVDEKEVDVEKLGNNLEKFVEEAKEKFNNLNIFIETGRYLVGKAGIYVTKVRDKKESFGKKFVILNNTLNGFYRASINQMVKLYTTEEKIPNNEPLFTSYNSTQISPLEAREETEKVTIMGNLCTGADVVEKEIDFPVVEIGDIVVFNNAGSYSRVLTPLQFASMEIPREYILRKNGKVDKSK